MKFNNLIKAIPFLSTLLLIVFLCISNQKENAKLRILIWNTPSLTLGNYLSISTGTGFIISYLITTNIARLNQKIPQQLLRFKDEDKHKQVNKESDIESSFDKTLIERDIKDPSPTINASFRIIGRTEGSNTNFANNKNAQFVESTQYEDEYDEKFEKNDTINLSRSNSKDWEDESYSRW